MIFICRGDFPEGQDATVICRVVNAERFAIEQSQVENWDLRVYDRDPATGISSTPIYEITGQTTDILETLAILPGWRLDSVGGNFKQKVARANFGSLGGHTYLFVWTLHCTSVSKIGDVKVVGIGTAISIEGAP